ELENLILTGTAAINGTGNTKDNALTGNIAANSLDGGTGKDTMTGGAGNDTYFVDNVGDKVFETGGGGTADLIKSTIAIDLTDATFTGQDIEQVMLTVGTDLNIIGNGLNNSL